MFFVWFWCQKSVPSGRAQGILSPGRNPGSPVLCPKSPYQPPSPPPHHHQGQILTNLTPSLLTRGSLAAHSRLFSLSQGSHSHLLQSGACQCYQADLPRVTKAGRPLASQAWPSLPTCLLEGLVYLPHCTALYCAALRHQAVPCSAVQCSAPHCTLSV